MAKYLHIDLDLIERLGLYGTEAMVFSALQFLCRSGEWKGSYSELAKWAAQEYKSTTHYAVNRLINKKLISFNNCTKSFNICTQTFNNCTKSKEERTKEEIYNNKLSECVKDAHAHEKEYNKSQIENLMLVLGGNQDLSVSKSTGLYKEVVSAGYLQPKQYIRRMYMWYEKEGKELVSPLGAMRWWMEQESKRPNGDKPKLTANESIFLRAFLDVIPEQGIVPMLDGLTCFDMTDDAVVFEFAWDEERVKRFDDWLYNNGVLNKMIAYNKKFYYKAKGA